MTQPPESFKHIVRIAGTDCDGSKKVVYGLVQVKGVGVNLARAIVNMLGIDPEMRLGYLSDDQVKKIEEILSNPVEHGIPPWMVNRQKDLETGKYLHLIGADLVLTQRADIERMIKMKCWKGVRHSLGLKVRGQRTRTTGRKGITVGVKRRRR